MFLDVINDAALRFDPLVVFQRIDDGLKLGLKDFFSVVLDPARLRIMLRELSLGLRDNLSVEIKNYRA